MKVKLDVKYLTKITSCITRRSQCHGTWFLGMCVCNPVRIVMGEDVLTMIRSDFGSHVVPGPWDCDRVPCFDDCDLIAY